MNANLTKNPIRSIRRTCLLLIASTPLFAATVYLVSVKQAISGDCPIVIDLNGNGQTDVGGFTTSQRQIYTIFSIPRFVEFDLQGGGKQNMDWVLPNTDGFLLDVRRGLPPKDIDGSWLFSNFDGRENGFIKLKEFDRNGDGMLLGEELADISLWVDNGDARFDPSEMKNLDDYSIVELPTESYEEEAPYGGSKMVANARKKDGDLIYMEDAWFISEDNISVYDQKISSLINW